MTTHTSSSAPSPTPTVTERPRSSSHSDEETGLAGSPSTKMNEKQGTRSADESSGSRTDSPASGSSQEKNDDERWTVNWDGTDDPEDPLNTPTWKKWAMTAAIAGSCACVTCCSSMASDTYAPGAKYGITDEFGIGEEVATLSISLFVAGLGSGPLFLGPVSEFIGRAKVLHGSLIAFFLLNFPVAFANNVAVHMIFRFWTGFAGSAFLSVSGGTIADVFRNEKVGTPMMIFSAAPFIGPVLGPLVSGFINQNTYWNWTYYVVLIWSAIMVALVVTLIGETFSPELLRRKAVRLRKETGEERWRAPVEKLDRAFTAALKRSIKTPFVLLTTQPMVLCLDVWSALILGILYLFFGGVPYVFRNQHDFDLQQTGLAFLGIGAGQVIAVACQPYFNRKYRQTVQANGGAAPPEARLHAGKYGAILCPLGIFLFGLTSFRNVHWIVPILMSSFFGAGMVFSFTSTFTYLVDAYRPVAASALASNSFARSAFAAGFPLFGQQLYRRSGAVGGTCLLGGLMLLTVPFPFVFSRIGERVRARSPFAAA